MTLVENVVGAVLILLFFLAAGIYITTNVLKDTETKIDITESSFLDDLYSRNLNSVLLVTEEYTGRPIANLLGTALYNRNSTIEFDGNDIDVYREFGALLNATYGAGKYYAVLRPVVRQVNLKFVIDGSPSLVDEMQEISTNMYRIVEEATENNRSVDIAIYILMDQSTQCQNYFPESIWNDTARQIGIDPSRITGSCIAIHGEESHKDWRYMYRTADDDYRRQWGINAPYTQALFLTTGRALSEFYQSDWASGAAYASYDAMNKTFALVNIIFPLSEELAGSSKPHECLTETRWSGPYLDDRYRRFYCDTCWRSCDLSEGNITPTEGRSINLIRNATRYIRENNHIVNPVLISGCNYKAEESTTTWHWWNYYYNDSVRGGSVVNPRDMINIGITGNSYCRDNHCKGCSIEPGIADETQFYKHVCFQPDCQFFELTREMNIMANATGGKVIILEDASNLTLDIQSVINQNIDSFRVELGSMHADAERYSYQRLIPMPRPGRFAELRVWVYKDLGGDYS